MKYTHFDDILPNHRTDFVMLYFAVYRSLRELEASVLPPAQTIPNGRVMKNMIFELKE